MMPASVRLQFMFVHSWTAARRKASKVVSHWFPCWLIAVELESFAAKRGNVSGDAIGGGVSSGRAGEVDFLLLRWDRIRSMVSWSSMQAMILTDPPQRLQTAISTEKTRFRRWAQVIAAWRRKMENSSHHNVKICESMILLLLQTEVFFRLIFDKLLGFFSFSYEK